jgi:uncharacterized NAD(P)/FAD-binding protein YdhS
VAESAACIAIIGSGFCGTVTALSLLRQVRSGPLRLLLIDRSGADGTATATDGAAPELLSAAAGRISVSSADSLEFLKFARDRMPGVGAEDFPPRALYGEYLKDKLAKAERASSRVKLERVPGAVVALEVWRPTHTFIIGIDDGREMTAAQVVLALGKQPDTLAGSSDEGSARFMRSLIANGLIQQEAMRTGARKAPAGPVINRFGRATRGLYYIGPVLRPDLQHATAIPELRAHAQILARELMRPAVARPFSQASR